MRSRGAIGLAVLLVVGGSVGCSMTNPTVRSQTPDNSGPIIGSAPGYGDFKRAPYMGAHGKQDFAVFNAARDNNFGYEGGYYAGPNGYYSNRSMMYTVDGSGGGYSGCPQCNNGMACPANGCPACGSGCGNGYCCNGLPHHYQTYQMNWPQNLVYPQQGVPAAMIQYPYYTLRGPTDFFMQ